MGKKPLLLDRDQRIRDPVHDLIKFSKTDPDDKVLWDLLQTFPLQRLRRIKQLGFSDFVYPGASHSRLSHSIGAMQMARRMLAVLERNNQINPRSRDHRVWRRATVCAALLHDVGHGPFSHVFEEISDECGISEQHVAYTLRIIQETEVKRILRAAGVFKETLSFFQQEAGGSAYSSIISSQLDADRLDFLMRDRHFTGVRSVSIDMEWLLDSLRIKKIPAEVGQATLREFTFVLHPKGRTVVEEFLSTYAIMYSNIYFHKTTRAVQRMVQDALGRVLTTPKLRKKLPKDDPIRKYFEGAPRPSLGDYLALDDTSVLNTLGIISRGDFGESTTIAKRVFIRDLYKCFVPPKRPKEELPQQQLSEFIALLRKRGFDYHMDQIPEKGYKQYEIMSEHYLANILIFSEYDNQYRPIADLIPYVRNFADRNPIRFYFKSEKDKKRASRLWDSLG